MSKRTDDGDLPLGWGKYADTPINELPPAYVGWALGRLLEEMAEKLPQIRALRARLDEEGELCDAEIRRVARELQA